MEAHAVSPVVVMDAERRVPDLTIESMARGFYREAERYGFSTIDFIRFTSSLLEIARNQVTSGRTADEGLLPAPVAQPSNDDSCVVGIRPFEREQDMAAVRCWLADDAGRGFLPPRPGGGSLTLEEIVDEASSVLGVVTLPDSTPIGLMAFLNYDATQRTAELRKLISPTGRGRGYGTAATRVWLRYGFEELDLHKIYLTTLDTNVRNVRLNERLGFTLEGIFRDELFIDGAYHDVLRMAIWNPRRAPRDSQAAADFRTYLDAPHALDAPAVTLRVR